MRDLERYALECMEELDRLNIKYSPNISFVINTRAKARFGLCERIGNSYVIEISQLLLDERVDEKKGLKSTIMHELLHTCRGCMKHTGRWAELSKTVNEAYGYNIKRATNPTERGIPEELQIPAKHLVQCDECGALIPRQRMSALIKQPEKYRCAKCGGRLTRIK
ncbi:MAG: hypothetical protein UH734_00300 [Ruminococcus sp.]|nr:hypothetical protein [Ruminococcus sp.]